MAALTVPGSNMRNMRSRPSIKSTSAMATGSPVLTLSRSAQRGFTYLGLMFLIVVIGIGLAAAGTIWQTEVQREKEKELLFVGEQFRQAIGSYYENTPNGIKQYPATLEDLLHDPRFPEMRRHLRRIYPDPVTGNAEWGLMKEQQRIVGVYSKSETQPLMKVFTGEGRQGFSDAVTYAGWAFIYKPTNNTATASPAVGDAPVVAGSPTVVPVTPPAQSNAQPGNPAADGGGESAGISPDELPPGRKQDCLVQRARDAAACVPYCKGGRPVAACSLCQASVARRYNACLMGSSLPPLAAGG